MEKVTTVGALKNINSIDTMFDNNMKRLFKLQLAFESYEDNTGQDLDEITEIYDAIDDLRRKRETLAIDEKIYISNKILKKCDDLIKKLGKDKFIIYKDGCVEYNWDLSLIEGGQNER